MKRTFIYLLILLTLILQPLGAEAGTRVFNAPRPTFRLLAKQFNSSADVFLKADPSLAGSSQTLTSATGQSKMDGSVTVAFGAGFTAPLAVTVYVWQGDNVNPAKAGWYRLGGAAAAYTTSVDTNYATINFSIAENTPFMIITDKSVTGDVYTDAAANIKNLNSQAGYPNQ